MLGNIDKLNFSYTGLKDLRNVKGYIWETTCNNLIKKIPNISVTHNPTSFTEWKSKNKDSSHDAIITINKNTVLSLEYKYRDIPKLYHSWFMECWYNKTSDIFIVNNPDCISYEDKRTLEQRGQKVMSLTEAIVYLGTLTQEPRKYILLLIRNKLYSNFKRRIIRFNKIKTVFDTGRKKRILNKINKNIPKVFLNEKHKLNSFTHAKRWKP